ncbi:MAG: hypothetical protein U5Q44_02970 [Dehalococcoidia bacterium]|nr:hypothetical protein [Dehalococcoidia bacterium]
MFDRFFETDDGAPEPKRVAVVRVLVGDNVGEGGVLWFVVSIATTRRRWRRTPLPAARR